MFESNIDCWGFPDSPLQYGRCIQKQSLCSNDFFGSLPTDLVCIISGSYTLCDFCRIFSATMICLPFKNFAYVWMIHFYFLTSPMTIAGETTKNNDLKFCAKFICITISIFIPLFFNSSCFKHEHAAQLYTHALNILSLQHLFCDFENFMCLFGRCQFWAPTLEMTVLVDSL